MQYSLFCMSLFCYNKKDSKGEKMMDDLKRYEELVDKHKVR